MTLTKEEVQAARLERKRRQAERRMRADFWLDRKANATTAVSASNGAKRVVSAFSVTLSYADVRAKSYRSIAEGDAETAVLLNELLKLRRRMEKAGPLLKMTRRLERAQLAYEAAVANACTVKLSPAEKGRRRKERREKIAQRSLKVLQQMRVE